MSIESIRERIVKIPEKPLMSALAVVIGIIVGLAGNIMKGAISYIQDVVSQCISITGMNFLYFVAPAVGIVLTVVFVKYLVKDDISHGITRVFYAISRRESKIKSHNCYSSVISSSLTIGFGGSVGAEAPIVLTGAAIGSNIGQALRLKYNLITLLLGCGAAAAISSVYKAPIAGFIFVLEVLMLDLTFTSLVPLLIASVSAVITTYVVSGLEPFFGAYIPVFKLHNLYYYAMLGVVGGLVSYYFSYTTMKLESAFAKITLTPLKIFIGALIIGVLIFFFPPLYGEGYSSIQNVLDGKVIEMFRNSFFADYSDDAFVFFGYIFLILVLKVVAMTFTNASGGVGGTFAPSLFVGATTGLLFALLMNYFFGLDLPLGSFTLVGMAAIMSGVMKAPITSMFLVAELTGGFQLFLPLMLTVVISFAISNFFEPYSIYTKRLAMRGELMTHDKDDSTIQRLDINDLIESDFISVREDAMLRDLIIAVESSRRNIFPVISSEGVFVGMVTLDSIRADMFDRNLWDRNSVSQYVVLPPDVIVVGEDSRSVIEKFENSRFWNLPVVDGHGYYKGFLSKSKLLTEYRQQLKKLTSE